MPVTENRRILYVDAYDSFSSNIAALLTQAIHAEVTEIKIDDKAPDSRALLEYAAVVFGPGPGHPENSKDIGSILQILNTASEAGIPVLGICLGFQVLCSLYGLPISRLPLPCHGHAKQILHSDDDIFCGAGIVLATCYNSLGVRDDVLTANFDRSRPSSTNSGLSTSTEASTPNSALSLSQEATSLSNYPKKELQLLARDNDGYIMAVKHEQLPHWGFQFHPESCKSNLACHKLLLNWWAAVADWNQQLARVQPVNLQRSPSDPGLSASSSSTLLKHLLSLTKSSGSSVLYRTTECRSATAQVSEMYRSLPLDISTVMLESVGKGRYSIYAMPSDSLCRIEYFQGVSNVSIDGRQATCSKFPVSHGECLLDVEKLVSIRRASGGDSSLPFWGGFLGFISYEFGLALLDADDNGHARRMPDLSLLWVERSIIVDHLKCTTTVQSIRNNDEEWVEKMVGMVNTETFESARDDNSAFQEALTSSNVTLPDEACYKAKIAACQEQLKAGNSYELCLTTEAQVRIRAGYHWDLYKNLKLRNPAPFSAYMHLGKLSIISSSPEQFMAWDREGAIDMIPMKGTVRKSPSMTFARATEILASPKEQAENLMIADLVRHDLYSALGLHANVSVQKLCEVIEHETVYQLVSHIRATGPIPADCDANERQRLIIHHGHKALRQALPPGSMTGAPKKRSCEILSLIENRPRGVYSGVLGYLDIGGGGCFSVCIRTAFSNSGEVEEGQQKWRIGAGGAITVLSDPEEEWQEMQTKLESTLRAFRPSQPVSYSA
jgi:para-aminobenzoate synthetase